MATIAQPSPSDELLNKLTHPSGGENNALLAQTTFGDLMDAMKEIKRTDSDPLNAYTDACKSMLQNSRLRLVIACTFDRHYTVGLGKDEAVKAEPGALVVGEAITRAIFNMLIVAAIGRRGRELVDACETIMRETLQTQGDVGNITDVLKRPSEVWRQTMLVAQNCALKAERRGLARLVDTTTTSVLGGLAFVLDLTGAQTGYLAEAVNGRYGLYNLPFNCCFVNVPQSTTPDRIVARTLNSSVQAFDGVELYTCGNNAFMIGTYKVVRASDDRTWFLELFRVTPATEKYIARVASIAARDADQAARAQRSDNA